MPKVLALVFLLTACIGQTTTSELPEGSPNWGPNDVTHVEGKPSWVAKESINLPLLKRDGVLSVHQPITLLNAMLKKQAKKHLVVSSQTLLKDLGRKRGHATSITQSLDSLVQKIKSDKQVGAKSLLNRLGKRGPALSFNNDLMALTQGIKGNLIGGSQSTLHSLGKRDPQLLLTIQKVPGSIPVQDKRGRPLSFNNDLLALTDYMRANKIGESRNTLGALGKRSRSRRGGMREMSVNQDLRTVSALVRQGRVAKANNLLASLG